jgi:hypothetical protein
MTGRDRLPQILQAMSDVSAQQLKPIYGLNRSIPPFGGFLQKYSKFSVYRAVFLVANTTRHNQIARILYLSLLPKEKYTEKLHGL